MLTFLLTFHELVCFFVVITWIMSISLLDQVKHILNI